MRFQFFMKSRTAMEIKRRCEILLRAIHKEFEEHLNELKQPMNASALADTQKPKKVGKRRTTTHSIEDGGTKKKRAD